MSQPATEKYTFVIEPAKGWQFVNVRELWQARELLVFLAWRDIKVRYKQTFLGAAWAILQPAMMMIVFTVLFGKIAKINTGDVPYPLFVYCGLLPWTFFATAMGSAANSVIGSERLITKIYFPRLIIPYSAVLAASIDFLVAMLLLIGMMFWYRVAPSWSMLLIPAIILFIAIAAVGIGTGLSAMNVSYRDFRYIIPFMIQFGLFATPAIMLPKTETENWLRTILEMNPLNALISSFRAAFLGEPIAWLQLGLAVVVVCVLFVLGSLYFRKVEDRFADII